MMFWRGRFTPTPCRTALLRKRGETSIVAGSDDEFERMRGASVFTHNHPGGTSFSPEDVALACALELPELRVVTSAWTHVVRPAHRGWNSEYWEHELEATMTRVRLHVGDELRQAISKRRLMPEEARLEGWHLVWERVAELDALDYERYTGERTDAF